MTLPPCRCGKPSSVRFDVPDESYCWDCCPPQAALIALGWLEDVERQAERDVVAGYVDDARWTSLGGAR